MAKHHSPTQNHLAHCHSPYLQQHAHNPVNWYPWGDEALTKHAPKINPFYYRLVIQLVTGVMSWRMNHLKIQTPQNHE